MGAKKVQDVPEDIAGAYLSVAFLAFMFFALTSMLSAINKDVNLTGTEESTEKGTWGALVLMLVGVGAILGATTLNAAYEQEYGHKITQMKTFNPLAIVGGMNPEHQSPAAMGRDDSFYDPAWTDQRKQQYWESNVGSVGMAKLVMSGKSHFKFGKDEYSKDHDYSRDAYRHGEEEERAYEARKLSERIRKERKRREEIEARRPIVQVMQAQPTPMIQPMMPLGYNPYAHGAPATMAPPNPAPHANKPVVASKNMMHMLPPYPVGHPLRDDRPYGIILFLCIIAWIGVLEAMRRQYFLDAEQKPRKPTKKEGEYIEMVRITGTGVLGVVTYLTVQTFVDNNPGTGSTTVAAMVATAVMIGAYFGSGELVETYNKVSRIPAQCFKFQANQFKDDPDYVVYEAETIKICTQGREETRELTPWEAIAKAAGYYVPFWGYMVVYILATAVIGGLVSAVDPGGIAAAESVKNSAPTVTFVAIGIMLVAMVIVPLYGLDVPFFVGSPKKKDNSEQRRADAMANLTRKLTTKCNPECTHLCQETLDKLIGHASRACDS